MSTRRVQRFGAVLVLPTLGLAACSSSPAPSIEALRAQIAIVDELQNEELARCDGDPACIAEVNRQRLQDRVVLIESHLDALSAHWSGRRVGATNSAAGTDTRQPMQPIRPTNQPGS